MICLQHQRTCGSSAKLGGLHSGAPDPGGACGGTDACHAYIFIYQYIFIFMCTSLYIYIFIDIDIDIDILYIYMTGRRYIYTTLSRHSKKWRTRC